MTPTPPAPAPTSDPTRRELLGAGLALAGLSAAGALAPAQAATLPTPAATPAAGAGSWHNWSGLQSCRPTAQPVPASEAEVVELLQRSSGPVRCVGAGHSFTPLVPTPGTLLSLDRLSGIVSVDAARQRAVVRAGTRIGVLARALDAAGLALHNQPDIDVQTLAGAFSTATHGTGVALPALHAHISALRLVTPAGELLRASRSERPEVFDAARVALGSLGVITEVELELRPRHFLHRHVWLERTASLLERAPTLAATHRHFELYVLPFTGYSAAIAHDEVPAQAPRRDVAQDEKVLDDLRHLRDWFGRWPGLRQWVAGKLIDPRQKEEAVDLSWRLLSTVRPTRFNESEYHVPREQGIACLREIVAALETRNDVFFPLEFRWIRGDDAWLSPFHGGDRNSIAVHALAGEPHDYLVSALGPIFRRHGGRPHWGKLHDMSAADLAARYPKWAEFQQVRRALDPRGRMLNDFTRKLFGETASWA